MLLLTLWGAYAKTLTVNYFSMLQLFKLKTPHTDFVILALLVVSVWFWFLG